MFKKRLASLFETIDPSIKNIILDVLVIEQEHISMDKPRVKEHIDTIVTLAAQKEISEHGEQAQT